MIKQPIIFFDGVCNLCNGFVDWLMKADKKGIFKVASLQGETAKQMLKDPAVYTGLASVILFDEEGEHKKSAAVCRILKRLGGIYQVLGIFCFIPEGLRNGLYDFVAKNRYRWFGVRQTCRLPAPREQERFLP